MAEIANLAFHSPLEAYEALVGEGQLHVDPAQARIVARLQQLHDTIDGYQAPSRIAHTFRRMLPKSMQGEFPRGLYLYGGVGRGKSMLMDLFYESAPVKRKRRVHFHAFMLDVHERIHRLRSENSDEDPILPIARELRDEFSLLCLDEFEVHDVADAMILARLIPLMLKRGVVMVITSNRAPTELYPNGLQRERFLKFVELFEQKVDVIPLDSGTDYRMETLRALDRTFWYPLGKESEQFIEDAFTRIAHGHVVQPSDIVIKGRTLRIEQTTSNAAMVSFHEMCEQPLGSEDYLRIAESFSTICLKDIPRMGPEKRNEARRFVMFIDAIYDHRVKLIATAEASPDALYESGTGQFEFERTVSRLQEIQSEQYMAEPHRAMLNAPEQEKQTESPNSTG